MRNNRSENSQRSKVRNFTWHSIQKFWNRSAVGVWKV